MTLVEELRRRASRVAESSTGSPADLAACHAYNQAAELVEADPVYANRRETRELLEAAVDQWYVEERDNVPDLYDRLKALLEKLPKEDRGR
jgi:hypothetical protein